MIRRNLGWLAPTAERFAALRHAGPVAGISVLVGVEAKDGSDNSNLLPQEPLDQLHLGSCVANAVVQDIYAALVLAGLPSFIASRLALYYWSRYQHGAQGQDTGTYICTCFDMAAELGLPPEGSYPYQPEFFADKPGPEVYRAAFDLRGKVGINYHQLPTSGDALVADLERACTAKLVAAFGVDVSDRFCSEEPRGTVMPPGPGESIAGGHAMVAAGHDRLGRRFLVRNSWGRWGDPTLPPGYFWMSYDYMARARDVWVCTTAPGGVR